MTVHAQELNRKLCETFHQLDLKRPLRLRRYDPGDVLTYKLESIAGEHFTIAALQVLKYAGGGFAGQVYQVKLLRLEEPGLFPELKTDSLYALKIMLPLSAFNRFFRNLIYTLGFQAPFQLQTSRAALRSGALWQKFIRRGAALRFGSESSVVNIHALLLDEQLHSLGELSEWIEGRTWRLEVDDQVNYLQAWLRGRKVPVNRLGSPEFRAKFTFMKEFTALLHDMGAHELARQYEWSTLKSQPNCLKRLASDPEPDQGLVAVDFRAGLALLPLLPMSPGDVKLIFQGLQRGSLVQFDRGNCRQLESFLQKNYAHFSDMLPLLDKLKETDEQYRNSLPDITHNLWRWFRPSFWSRVAANRLDSWLVKDYLDDEARKKLSDSRLAGFIALLLGSVPVFGRFLLRIFHHRLWQSHYRNILFLRGYLGRALRGNILEKVLHWHQQGRLSGAAALRLASHPALFYLHLPLSLLPAGLHRFLIDSAFRRRKLHSVFIRPFQLYFKADLRREWLSSMLTEGIRKHILSTKDAAVIGRQLDEPFIQKYLKSLAVHILTIPITQIVSIMVAILYIMAHPELPPAQAWGIGLGIIALFQVIPVSPGSLLRGLYVTYLVIRERDFRNYNLALPLAYFKYIGYLAFPIQMAYRYPALARFMAGHWATEAVHIVPVFGEKGAWLEHKVFGLFYNWPLTLKRQHQLRYQLKKSVTNRYWH
ncbi:MAG: hypothetical protein JW784_01050, partial [Candidatus Cloacimonetes bacterium]|nr:hypothetical protein [Candidatus Cloacimonadota bacterium]